jgi:hypothetical protein
MLPPIDFDDQAMFTADEIYNVRSDRLLPHKLHSVKRTRAKSIPKSLFRYRGISAQPSRIVHCNFCATHEATPVRRSSRPDKLGRQIGLGSTAGASKAPLLLPLPSIRASTPVFDGLCGERVGVSGPLPRDSLRISGKPIHNHMRLYTFSTSGRPSRPWGRKISVMARIEKAATSL